MYVIEREREKEREKGRAVCWQERLTYTKLIQLFAVAVIVR